MRKKFHFSITADDSIVLHRISDGLQPIISATSFFIPAAWCSSSLTVCSSKRSNWVLTNSLLRSRPLSGGHLAGVVFLKAASALRLASSNNAMSPMASRAAATKHSAAWSGSALSQCCIPLAISVLALSRKERCRLQSASVMLQKKVLADYGSCTGLSSLVISFCWLLKFKLCCGYCQKPSNNLLLQALIRE